MARYVRLYLALARYGLARELAFRGNFLIKMAVEVLWLVLLLVFYRTVFTKTSVIASWTEAEYLFFVGCYFALAALIETLFLDNCNAFADLIRSGDLDFYLLKPLDEQFLITCRNIDWTTAPNVLVGIAIMAAALGQLHWTFDPVRAILFVGLFGCGLALAYGFLLLLTSASMWFVRNQSLFELWWFVTTLLRYPREIFDRPLAAWMGWFFTYLVPVMLVVNVPAHTLVKVLDPRLVAYTVVTTVVVLVASRKFFRYALRRYRSASS